jgi:zinc-ribbon domain
MTCARCGTENPADSRFCAQCGAPLAAEREVRKTDDFEPNVRALSVLARVAARRGDAERGLELAHEAVALAEPTDYLETRADMQLALAEVARAANRPEEEASAAAYALELYELKGDLVGARRVRAFTAIGRAVTS